MIEAIGKMQNRVYQDLARSLSEEKASGKFPVGTGLPAERELVATYMSPVRTCVRRSSGLKFKGWSNDRLAYAMKQETKETGVIEEKAVPMGSALNLWSRS